MIKVCPNPTCSAIWHNCELKDTRCKNCNAHLVKINDEQYNKKFAKDFHQYDFKTEDLFRPINKQQKSKKMVTEETNNQTGNAEVTLTAYNVKTKQKNVPILDAIITKTAKGAYMAQGHDGNGAKLTTLLGKEKAQAVVAAGLAKFAEGVS